MNNRTSVQRRTTDDEADRPIQSLRLASDNGEIQTGPFAYAGVGSRRTPRDILDAMADIAQALGDAGVALSTGGADGADKAFETGALRTDAPITVHTPWPGYNGYWPGRSPRTEIDVVRPDPADVVRGRTYADVARAHHPCWRRCGRGARALFIRNVSILAGALDGECGTLPVRAVIAHTPNGLAVGRESGGTGHTLRTAAWLGIACVNLSPRTPPERNAAALAAVPEAVREAVLGRLPELPR